MSYPDPYMQGFMQAISSETKGVFIRHLFVDINDGYLSDSIAFSQITYSFSVSQQGDCIHKKIVEKDGLQWLSLSHSDWWEACRLNKNTIKAVLKRIVDRGLIKTIRARIGDENQVRTLIRPDYEKISESIKATRSDRNDLTVGSKRSDGSDRNDLTVGSFRSDGSDRNDLTVGSKRSNPPYIENLKDKEEEQRRSPERGREEFFEEEVIFGEIVSEDEPTRSDFVVKKAKDSGSDLEILREDQIAAAPKESREATQRAENAHLTPSSVDDRDVPGFADFKGVYEGLLLLLGRSFGSIEDARISWNVVWQGLYPPKRFWDGLKAYVDQKKGDFSTTGKAIGVFGPVNFLRNSESSWETALKIDEIRSEAMKTSVDLSDPLSIRFARERMATEQAGQEFLRRRAMKRLENVV